VSIRSHCHLYSSVALLWVSFVLPFLPLILDHYYHSTYSGSNSVFSPLHYSVQFAKSLCDSHPPLLILSTHHPVVVVCGLSAHHPENRDCRSSRPTRLSSVGLCSAPSRTHRTVVCVLLWNSSVKASDNRSFFIAFFIVFCTRTISLSTSSDSQPLCMEGRDVVESTTFHYI